MWISVLISGPVLKLADFGFAQYFTSDETKSALRGSPLYMAPEMVLDRRYDAKVDLWSVGVILYESLFGKAPYKSDTLEELLQKIKSEQPILIPRGTKLSEDCRDLLGKFSRVQANGMSRGQRPENHVNLISLKFLCDFYYQKIAVIY